MVKPVHKILILGASGMLGHQMWRKLNRWSETSRAQVFGTVRKNKDHYKKLGLPQTQNLIDGVDVADFKKLNLLLDEVKPTVVINCVGLTLRKKDLGDIEKCYHLNAMLPQFVGQWCNTHKAKLFHFSTDCVFDGKKGAAYAESDLPTAFDHYGISKYLGEAQTGVNLTMRLSIVGRELENRTELFEWIFAQANGSANGFSSAKYTGLTTGFVANEVIRVLENYPELSGLYQVSSEVITKYEIMDKLNKKFNLGIQIEKNGDYVVDKSLDCSRYQKATGFVQPSWNQMIDDLYLDREFYENLNKKIDLKGM